MVLEDGISCSSKDGEDVVERENEERGGVCAGLLVLRPGDRNTSHTLYVSQGIAPSYLVIRSRRYEYLAKIVATGARSYTLFMAARSLYRIIARLQTI